MYFTKKTTLVAGAVSAMVLLGSVASQAEKLSLEKCEQLAFEHSLEASSLKTKLQSQQLQRRASEAALKPSVNLTSLGSSIEGQDKGETQVSPLSVGLSLKQPIGHLIPDDGIFANTTAIGVKTSDISWQMAQLDSQKSTLDLKYQVRAAYISYLKAKDSLALSQEELKRIETKLLPEVNAKLKAGVATKVDVLNVESQSRNARLTVTKAEHALDQAKDALLRLIGPMADSESLDLEQLEAVSADQSAASLEDLTKTAVESRVETKKAQLSLEQAKLTAKRVKLESSMYVTLGAEYDRTWLDQGLTIGTGASITSKDMAINGTLTGGKPGFEAKSGSNWQISLKLTSPILDWGQAEAGNQQAQKDVDSAAINLEQAKADILDEVRDAFYGLNEAQEKLVVSKMNLEANDSSLTITRARYDAGVASSSELLDAELALFEARSSVSQAEYDLFSAADRLAKATGGERSAAQ